MLSPYSESDSTSTLKNSTIDSCCLSSSVRSSNACLALSFTLLPLSTLHISFCSLEF
ncbi:hypothetical protein AKO1_002710 [Acrasis kona]|uniref:Uncharacterized protein n=1 Tax=Acrasis kona TaxID=1008807 RepID=A0AAW2ZQI9_9EUKA